MTDAREMRETFGGLYGGEGRVYRAPGRVNLIGEHTDYNEGFVMPAAIDSYTWAAVAPRDDRRVTVRSENFSEAVEFELDETEPQSRLRRGRRAEPAVFELDETEPQRRGHWSDYMRGVAVTLERAGVRLRGADVLIKSDVPVGAGLSSSAAVEVAVGYAMLDTSGLAVDRVELARLCQRAENEFVGVRCGLMDQFIASNARAGHALMLDCRSLDFSLLPLPAGVRLVVCNTMVRHELAGGEYNARRAECEEGVRLLARALPRVRALRDVTAEEIERFRNELPEVVYRRCRHVVTENARVVGAKAALEVGDLDAFGRLMRESHRSLRDDYEVSCAELDLLVKLACDAGGVYGARMTGGGFGGCTVNLLRAGEVESFRQTVARGYEHATGRAPEIYICSPAQGVGRVVGE